MAPALIVGAAQGDRALIVDDLRHLAGGGSQEAQANEESENSHWRGMVIIYHILSG